MSTTQQNTSHTALHTHSEKTAGELSDALFEEALSTETERWQSAVDALRYQ